MNEQIQITHLKIQNFRNLTSIMNEDITSNRVAIAGKNHIGKTNTIQALYWLFTDKLLNDVSDIASIKPTDDESKDVIVTINILDTEGREHIVSKTYTDVYTKSRDNGERVFKGHSTEYSIDNIAKGTYREFKLEFLKLLGLNNVNLEANVDIVQLLIDPLYFSNLEWTLRDKLVRELTVDISHEAIFKANVQTLKAKEILEKHNFDSTKALKDLSGDIDKSESQIKTYDAQIEGLKLVADVTNEELANAEKEIANIDDQIVKVKNDKVDDTNVKTIERLIAEKKLEISQSKIADKERYEARNKSTNEKIATLNDELMTEHTNYYSNRAKVQNLESEIKGLSYKIQDNKRELESSNNEIKRLLEEYRSIKKRTFDIESQLCPTCGAHLKEEEIAKHKEEFETKKNSDLETNVSKGKSLREKTSRLGIQAHELDDDLNARTLELDNAKKELELSETKCKSIQNSLEQTKASLEEYIEVASINALQLDLKQLESDLDKAYLDNSIANRSVDSRVNELVSNKKIYVDVVDKHKYYLNTQTRIAETERLRSLICKSEMEKEQLRASVKLYKKIELQLRTDILVPVFGDLKFKLAQDNIVGTWDPVNKPYIKGKNVLFDKGSTSEQIKTGIALIEAIKKALNVPNLPILFDEGETLDSETINALDTDSQIICALVNNIYTQPTVIELGGAY